MSKHTNLLKRMRTEGRCNAWHIESFAYISDWDSGTKFLGVLVVFHRHSNICRNASLAKVLQGSQKLKVVSIHAMPVRKASATHKIPVSSREDAAAMREQGEITRNNIPSLKDPKLADIHDARADLSETEEDRDLYVFLGTL
jgi:hypothetical protein